MSFSLPAGLGPTGRDNHRRYVRKGSIHETFGLDTGLVYKQASITSGRMRILGRVETGRRVWSAAPPLAS
jgi:hypothetical protein